MRTYNLSPRVHRARMCTCSSLTFALHIFYRTLRKLLGLEIQHPCTFVNRHRAWLRLGDDRDPTTPGARPAPRAVGRQTKSQLRPNFCTTYRSLLFSSPQEYDIYDPEVQRLRLRLFLLPMKVRHLRPFPPSSRQITQFHDMIMYRETIETLTHIQKISVETKRKNPNFAKWLLNFGEYRPFEQHWRDVTPLPPCCWPGQGG